MTHKKILYCVLFAILEIVSADPICTSLPDSLKNKPLTLIELSDIALSCSSTTRIGWSQIKLSLANLGINYSKYWPQLNATYGYVSSKDNFKKSKRQQDWILKF